MVKRTLQRNKRRRAKTGGFLSRSHTAGGALVLQRRRRKGRSRLAV